MDVIYIPDGCWAQLEYISMIIYCLTPSLQSQIWDLVPIWVAEITKPFPANIVEKLETGILYNIKA